MTAVREFRLPDVGEGLTEAEILTWHVRPGDRVAVNEPLVEIETAKASVELPSPYAGVVSSLHVAVGDLVPVGTPIVSIEVTGVAGPTTGPTTGEPTLAASAAPPGEGAGDAPDGAPAAEQRREAVLVGYGVRADAVRRRPRHPRAAAGPHGTEAPEAGPPGEPVKPVRHGGLEVGRLTEARAAAADGRPVRTTPPVRRLARDLGVDLRAVTPTGRGGLVTREDVTRAAAAPGGDASLPSTARRVPVRGVARAMADAMVRSAFTAPHVTEWVDVDVSRSVDLVSRLRANSALGGVRVTPMTLAAYALVRAAARHPDVNSSYDADAGEIVLHPHVNLGVAAATPRGLVVPVVREADTMGLGALARALHALTEAARAGTTPPTDMLGGTISITNVGVFGVDGGTPILVPGQSAILCLGRVLDRAWVVDGAVAARPVVELTLSFDHRIVDGALGSAVLADVAGFLHDPEVALALG